MQKSEFPPIELACERLNVDGAFVLFPAGAFVAYDPAGSFPATLDATGTLMSTEKNPDRFRLSPTTDRLGRRHLHALHSSAMIRILALSARTLAVVTAAPMTVKAEKARPPAASLPVPPGATEEQVLLGDRIFHGEAAHGKCSECHGVDAKGTANGNDLTLGMWIWGDGSLRMIKGTITHNMAMAPGMDGNLSPADVDAVTAYIWALGHQKKP